MSLTPSRPVRVALVNDVELLLRGIEAMLAPYAERVRVVQLTTAVPAAGEVDVVLYDTFGRQPRDDERLARLLATDGLRVLVFSWASAAGRRAQGAGVDGYLHKGASALEVVEAVEAVQAGRPVAVVDPRGAGAGTSVPDRESGLSVREAEMLTLIARGHTNQEIADLCFLSVNSVKTYIRSAYRKIGITRRAEAVRWGVERGVAGSELPVEPVPEG